MIVRAARLLVVAAVMAVEAVPSGKTGNSYGSPEASQNSCLDCHSRAEGVARDVVALHQKSVHARLGCASCHGGDQASSEKARAHSGNWKARPGTDDLLLMCGSCHAEQPVQYRSGKHGIEKPGAQRPVCTSCHGVHTIGSPPETFSFVTYCAGCHGLEYLPALPADFQSMLSLVDELREESLKAGSISQEAKSLRASIRMEVSTIVHRTDRKLGTERIPGILEKGEKLKSMLKGKKP
jgi:hypothetical protein